MSTSVTWNGNTYSIPASGETGWAALSSFLIALGNGAAVAEEMKQAIRVATTSPVTVSDTTDCVVAVNRSVAGATTVNLPAGTDGRWFVVVDQKADAATNNITVTPNGAETINGSATYVMSQNNEAIVLAYSATNTRWNVVARFTSGAPLSNPMAATGDMIYGGASGSPTKLATGATTGLLHGGNGAVPTWSLLVNADVSASAAIDGSKIVSASGAQAGVMTGSAQSFNGVKTIADTTDASSSTTGALIVSGGVGIAKKLNVGTTLTFGGGLFSSYAVDSSTSTPRNPFVPSAMVNNLTASATISIEGITDVANGQIVIIMNNTGNNMTFVNTSHGNTADIITGTGSNFVLANTNCAMFIYIGARWHILKGVA